MKKILLFALSCALFSNGFAQCNELFISEYVEGTGNNKALEIFNPTNSAIDLSTYRIERCSNGSSTTSSGGTLNLTGNIAAHHTFVIANGQTTTVVIGTGSSPPADTALQHKADLLDGPYPAPMYMNGNDAIVFFKGTKMIDLFGKIGDAAMVSSYGWSDASPYDGSTGAGKIWTENHTLVRKPTVLQGDTINPTGEFIVTTEWDSLPEDTWTGLGSHICNCATGVHETDNSVSVVLYPNPSNTGYFTISADENIQSVAMYDVLGREMIRKEPGKGTKNTMLETGAVVTGIYIVKLSYYGGKSSVLKVSLR